MWEEGEAIIKLQSRLREIQLEKEEIEKLKKRAKSTRRSNAASKAMPPPNPVESSFGSSRMGNGLPLINENSESSSSLVCFDLKYNRTRANSSRSELVAASLSNHART